MHNDSAINKTLPVEKEWSPDGKPPELASEQRKAIELGTDDDLALDLICSAVADGCPLSRIGRRNRLSNLTLRRWLTGTKHRLGTFEAARRIRDEMMKDTVIEQAHIIATADIRDAYHPDGSMKSPHELPDSIAPAVANIKTSYDNDGNMTKELKLNEKLKANELLGKAVGLFIERSESNVVVSLEDLVMASYRVEEQGNGTDGRGPGSSETESGRVSGRAEQLAGDSRVSDGADQI